MIFPIKGFTSTEEKPCWYYFRFSYLQIRIQSHLPLLWADLSSDKTDIYAMGKKAWPPAPSTAHQPARQRWRASSPKSLARILHERGLCNHLINILLRSYLPSCQPRFSSGHTLNIEFKLLVSPRCGRIQLHGCRGKRAELCASIRLESPLSTQRHAVYVGPIKDD